MYTLRSVYLYTYIHFIDCACRAFIHSIVFINFATCVHFKKLHEFSQNIQHVYIMSTLTTASSIGGVLGIPIQYISRRVLHFVVFRCLCQLGITLDRAAMIFSSPDPKHTRGVQ